MALRDITNEKSDKYKVQAWVGKKYKPLIIRGRPLDMQVSRSEFEQKRRAGCQNLDLWLDSSLYPVDLVSGNRPKLDTPSQLLEFLGDGQNGFLGYVTKLETMSGGTSSLVNEKEIEISVLRSRIDKLIQCSAVESSEFQIQVQNLKDELASLQSGISVMQNDYEGRILNLTAEISMREDLQHRIAEMEQQHREKLQEIEISQRTELNGVIGRLKVANTELKKVQAKLNRLVRTPYGFRSQVRKRRDLCDLAPKGGHAKAARRLARLIVAPETSRRIQEENATASTHKRLYGNKEFQIETGKVFGSILSQTEVQSLLNLPVMKPVGIKVANQYLAKVGDVVGPHEILEVCDKSGITLDGYNKMFKTFKGGLQVAGKGLKIGCMPNPHQVQLLRKALNGNFEDLVGQYMCINGTYKVTSGSKNSSKMKEKALKLDNFNNLFLDVEAVQRTMIRLYKFTIEELKGSRLIFVLKMDEAEIVYGEKLERMSITIMNRALDEEITKDNEKYFSVQSEREIWPIGCFRVPKENYEVLKWVLEQTNIPSLVEAQNSGQVLDVEGVGSFQIQWHLASDMKTIKALYGLSNGANAKHCCIYCMQEKTKTIIRTEADVILAQKKRVPTWSGGVFAPNISPKPVSLGSFPNRWKPIIPIPLEKVHICTLHALNRICEKILHLHFQNVWTIRDKKVQKLAIEDMERILSSIGMHGGQVKIFKDPDLSAKLFKKSTLPSTSDRIWKDIVMAERNGAANGTIRHDRMACWVALEKLLPYFTGLTLTEDQCTSFKDLAHEFGRLFVKVYGEHHVTHYLHVFIKHGSWFVDQYGSLSIWSCQGMEFSHHAAKVVYHRHTAHSGSINKKNPFLQTYQHWFRIIQHRFRSMDMKDKESLIDKGTAEEIVHKRREISINSSASAHATDWRAKCDRVGSRWVPRALNNEGVSNNEEDFE